MESSQSELAYDFAGEVSKDSSATFQIIFKIFKFKNC